MVKKIQNREHTTRRFRAKKEKTTAEVDTKYARADPVNFFTSLLDESLRMVCMVFFSIKESY